MFGHDDGVGQAADRPKGDDHGPAVVVLIVFDTLALRAGTDSRPGFGDDRDQEPRARFLYPRFM